MKAIFSAAMAAGVLAGCSTVITDTVQEVEFISMPAGARVSTSGYGSCITPCSLVLSKKQRHTAQIELEGFETEIVFLDPQYQRWGVVTTLLNGPLGMAIDDAAGANETFYLDPVRVALRPGVSTPPVFDPGYMRRPEAVARVERRLVNSLAPEAGYAGGTFMTVLGTPLPTPTFVDVVEFPKEEKFCLIGRCEDPTGGR